MNEYTTEDAEGNTWHVWIDTDVESFWFPGMAVPQDHTVFDYDDELRWSSGVFAYREDSGMAHEVVNIRSLQWEPPTLVGFQDGVPLLGLGIGAGFMAFMVLLQWWYPI